MKKKSDRPAAATVAAAGADAQGIGRRVRQLRVAQKMRLKDLALAASCSESLLSRVENNLANPSLATAHRLASALGVSTVALFETTSPEGVVLYRPSDRVTIGRGAPGEQAEVLIPHADNRRLEGFITILLPGADASGPYQHDGEEVGFVLEGRLELKVGETLHQLQPGDSFFFHSDVPHRYRALGDTVCRVVWINTPPTF